ncbi:hypothetical protein FA13DRAFT_1727721 [Coprinellus micaceus]|uniref:Fe2OG dioxygenase domain-containing protein n=1 Tax=Coprinellus micaceus TaxID=71717 RepID=A0A4Y7TPS0_COPMI|nr:hypothetical protein FA13DRAFT_1727721 [Coprinellus micaceus]
MAPKGKSKGDKKGAAASTIAPTTKAPPTVIFPTLAEKIELECTVVMEDQILIIDDLFSPQECKEYVKFIDNLPLELTPPPKKDEATRVNHRFSITSLDFSQKLHSLLSPHLPSFPYPSSVHPKRRAALAEGSPRHPHSFNSNIRIYKYTKGQYFGPHYDDSVKDALTGDTSEWTLLIYLTGEEDGVQGGETLFHQDQRGKPRETITPPLKRGSALLHRHGFECMLHEGSPVLKGTKYVLRSDLMFTR